MIDLAALVGARLQRIDAPHPDLLALSLFGPERGVLAFWLPRGGRAEWSWLATRPRGKPANSWVLLLRKHLLNRRLRAVETDGAETRLVFDGATLAVQPEPADVRLFIDGREVHARHGTDGAHASASALPQVPASRIAEHLSTAASQERTSLRRLARRRMKSLRRRLAAIDDDIRAADEADSLRHTGQLLLAHLHAVDAHAREVQVTDWNTDPPSSRRLAIPAGKSVREHAEALFHRARKRERGAEIGLERHLETQHSLEKLEALCQALDDPEADVARISEALEREGARPQRAAGHRAGPGDAVRAPFHRFVGVGQREIRVGRSARENDALTLRHAKPWDRWLHARGVSGSHVVVPLGRGEVVPEGLLLDAAHLAAYFSQSQGEAVVEIQHAARRHVVKPRGAAPGAVRVRNESVLVLRVEPDRLTRLLGRPPR